MCWGRGGLVIRQFPEGHVFNPLRASMNQDDEATDRCDAAVGFLGMRSMKLECCADGVRDNQCDITVTSHCFHFSGQALLQVHCPTVFFVFSFLFFCIFLFVFVVLKMMSIHQSSVTTYCQHVIKRLWFSSVLWQTPFMTYWSNALREIPSGSAPYPTTGGGRWGAAQSNRGCWLLSDAWGRNKARAECYRNIYYQLWLWHRIKYIFLFKLYISLHVF